MIKQVLLLLSAAVLVNCAGKGYHYGTKNVHAKKAPETAPAAPNGYAQLGYTAMISPPAVPPSPYSFGYDADGSARQESSDGSGKVTGSYTVVNEDGSKRVVKYVADEQGFRAMIDTDEPGTKSDNPADIELKSSAKAPVLKAGGEQKRYSAAQHQTKLYQAPIPQSSKFASGPSSESAPIPPYSFSYTSQLDDGASARSESSDGSGTVSGTYSLSNMDGRQRKVDYSADQSGFKASVDTNEFGTKSESPADVKFYSSAPQEVPQQQQQPAHYRPQESSFHQKPSYQSQKPYVQEEFQPISPYDFSYSANLEDGSIYRTETSDGSGKVSGSYKLSVADGRQRTVEYSADHGGFRANVNTNEFGTKAESPADVMFYSTATEEEPAPYKSPSSFRQEQRTQSHGATYQQKPVRFGISQQQQEDVPSPYSFNYKSQMEEGTSSRSESADASGKVTGSYSLSHIDGTQRKVEYTADEGGFKAVVQTNEFGTKSDSPADVVFQSSAPEHVPAAPKPRPAAHAAPVAYAKPAHSGYAQQEQQMVKDDFPRFPYAFNYEADGSARQESSDDSGKVTGTYSVTNEDGSTRIVEYIADEMGFRAKVKTNEPGTKSDNPADVSLHSSAEEVKPMPAAHPAKPAKPAFPERTYTQKSSMISQETIY